MKVINLYGCPNSGKSTFAAALFVQLKRKHLNVEIVGEKTKELIYGGNLAQMDNQFYLTALQYKKLKDLERAGTEICISDSPLLLQLFYGQDLHYAKTLNQLAIETNREFSNLNILLKRKAPYSSHGRYHTEKQAIEIEKDLLKNLNKLGISKTVEGTEEGLENLISYVTDWCTTL